MTSDRTDYERLMKVWERFHSLKEHARQLCIDLHANRVAVRAQRDELMRRRAQSLEIGAELDHLEERLKANAEYAIIRSHGPVSAFDEAAP